MDAPRVDMKPVRIFQHQNWIGPGRIAEMLEQRKIPYEFILIDRGDAVPANFDDVSAMVFLGGIMSANDPLPWIDGEIALIRQGQERGVPMLGHCLGSQLISRALGGEISPMPAKEIGWHKVVSSRSSGADEWMAGVPDQVEILIWHHDAFTVPPGAASLYSGEFCPAQAFAIGNTLATVAHIEVTAPLLRSWLNIYGHDIEPVWPSVQPIEMIRQDLDKRVETMHATLTDRLYDRWLARFTPA